MVIVQNVLISIALFSLVNLDNIEKKRNKKEKDSDTDDDTLSSKRRNLNKRKEKEAEESLMDHLKRIENDDGLETVKAERLSSDEAESVHLQKVKEIDAPPLSNETLMLEADRRAKETLLISSDSDNGKINSLLVGKENCCTQEYSEV